MQYKCDKCGKAAAVHLTEIVEGNKLERHLCEACAVTEGIAIKSNIPISQLLEDFILHGQPAAAPEDPKCEVCGLAFSEFRKQQLLGCPHDYDAFDDELRPLIERSQEGAVQHVGKVPHQAPDTQRRQNAMLRLRAELRVALAREDYEQAAGLRDQIKRLENP